MSADLDFYPDPAQIRPLKIRPGPKPVDAKLTTAAPTTTSPIAVDEEDPAGFQTPTSEKHAIPAVSECPPAPRKPKRAIACKRKLIEFDFFEAVNRDEVEGFFRSSFDDVVKRRCFSK